MRDRRRQVREEAREIAGEDHVVRSDEPERRDPAERRPEDVPGLGQAVEECGRPLHVALLPGLSSRGPDSRLMGLAVAWVPNLRGWAPLLRNGRAIMNFARGRAILAGSRATESRLGHRCSGWR
jgi:hypothetical protein